ncbi:hypothetical protein EC973_004610 [Apophysomyces ossiformis]|uniref:Single-stranded DNA binding protein Ssb-like OB fold domain-containing protein n=1 Tax=Apophysomyces ossiformis TaxID=679940 RepID=A0A8H7BSV4_9FUNG|nr:hypothetical protein EC973_004610 [Apophysomyces ossiformis]
MGKAKKKLPITAKRTEEGKPFKRSSIETARLIRRFHVLNKELAKCRHSSEQNDQVRKRQAAIEAEMESMGGLDWYQKASQLGQSKKRGGDSSKWLIKTLKEKCGELLDSATRPIQILDVGAVAPDNYKSYESWIKARPIDLNPQHPDIEKHDFLCLNPPEEKYDIVCLSLVVNFVGDPKDRANLQNKVASLHPDQWGVELVVKVVELLVSVETSDELSGGSICVSEYVVGDETGCIIIKTTSGLNIGKSVRIKNGYTEVLDGYMRLVATDVEEAKDAVEAMMDNNVSSIKFVRKP